MAPAIGIHFGSLYATFSSHFRAVMLFVGIYLILNPVGLFWNDNVNAVRSSFIFTIDREIIKKIGQTQKSFAITSLRFSVFHYLAVSSPFSTIWFSKLLTLNSSCFLYSSRLTLGIKKLCTKHTHLSLAAKEEENA